MIVPGTRYRLVRWLGEGGMGAVYEGLHLDTERRVALKVLHWHLCSREKAVAEFRREAKVSARIDNSGIVEVLDLIELDDGRLMCVMEYLHGRDLGRLVVDGPIAPGRLIGILRQACKTLAAAHAAGIVHCDIKPENLLLVEKAGRADVLKVLDFGIAAFLDEATTLRRMTGTPGYMAPEQIVGLQTDRRVDIYAIGSTAYRLVSGTNVFDPTDTAVLLNAHLTQNPTPLSGRVTYVPRALEAVILRCLAVNPDDRYADMAQLEAALCEAQIAEGLVSGWDDLPLPDIDETRRHTLAQAYRELAPAERRRGHGRWTAVIVAVTLVLLAAMAISSSARQPATVSDTRADQLATRARNAAAKSAFVYPATPSSQQDTAYQAVLALETLARSGDDSAGDHARRLRKEFATTLSRLGDRFWQLPTGRGFAIDYYIQAAIFEPSNDEFKRRALVTPGELARIASAASSGSFTPAELIAVEPLAILASSEAKADLTSSEGIGSIPPASSSQAKLRAIVGPSAAAVGKQRVSNGREKSRPSTAASSRVDGDAKKDTGSLWQQAAEYAGRGRAALAAGRTTEAKRLFHRSLGFNPNNVSSLASLGRIAFDEGHYDQSVKYRERVIVVAPRSAKHRIDLGDAYFKVLHYRASLEQYEVAEQLGSSQAAARLAKIRARLGL